MKRPSIKLALGVLFTFLTIAAVGQGAFALLNISSVNDAAVEIGTNSLNGVDLARQMDTDSSNFRLGEVAIIDASDAASTQAAEALMAEAASALQDDQNAYEAQITTDSDRVLFTAYKSNWAAYLAMHDKMMPEASKEEVSPEAMRFFAVDMAGTFDNLGNMLQQLVDSNKADAALSLSDAQAHYETSRFWTFVVLAITIAAGLSSVWFGFVGIAAPIGRITARMKALTDGDRQTPVPFIGRADEVGAMASALEVFREAAVESVRLSAEAEAARQGVEESRIGAEQLRSRNEAERETVARQQATAVEALGKGLARLADGELVAISTPFDGALEDVRAAFNQTIDRLSTVITQLRGTSGALRTATGEILSGTNDLADRTSKQAAAIEETSAAMEQLAGTVAANATRAASARQSARQVSQAAEETGSMMERSNDAMQRISSSSSKISNIIGLIDDIAFQTNLLALNASVEAARAGDAGKGFAVVAVEVRRLAQSAASASAEVKVLVEQSSNEVSSGGKLVADAAVKVAQMLAGVHESAQLIEGIANANEEQANSIGEVTSAIRQMDEMTQHNAALVEQTNAAIDQTEGQARALDKIVEVFVVTGSPPPRSVTVPVRPAQAKAGSRQISVGNTALKSDWDEF